MLSSEILFKFKLINNITLISNLIIDYWIIIVTIIIRIIIRIRCIKFIEFHPFLIRWRHATPHFTIEGVREIARIPHHGINAKHAWQIGGFV